jgi:hypothetical protein
MRATLLRYYPSTLIQLLHRPQEPHVALAYVVADVVAAGERAKRWAC